MDCRQGCYHKVAVGGQDGLFGKSALLYPEKKDEVCIIAVAVSGH